MADEKRQVIIDVQTVADVSGTVELTTHLKKLQKEQKALGDITEENAEDFEKYNVAIKATQKSIQENRKATQDSIKANNSKRDSLTQLRKVLIAQKNAYADLSGAERAGAKGTDLLKKISDTTAAVSKGEEAMGVYSRSVGHYEKANKSLNAQLSETPGALGNVVKGTNNASAAFTKLIANPIVLVVTLLGAALIGLVAGFKQTKVGAELFATAGAAINGVLSVGIGVVNKLAKGLKGLFTNPLESLKAFGKGLKGFFTNPLKSFKALGKAISDTTNDAVAQVKAFAALERQRIAVRQSNRELAKSLEELKTQQQEYNIIAEDDTRNWEEREKAAKSMLSVTEQIAQKELRIAQNNLDLLEKDIKLREANGEEIEDLKDQQLAAIQALANADRSYRTTIADRAEKDAKRERDLIEKNLDALQKDIETRRGILLEAANDEDLSFKARAKNISELQKLQNLSFAEQLVEIQKLTDVQINANDLLEASNSQLLLASIRELGLSEIGEQRLIEIIADRKIAVNDLSTSYRELSASQADGVKELLRLTTDEQIEEITNKYQDVINSLSNIEAPDRGLFATDEEYKVAIDKYSEFMLEKDLIAKRLTKQREDDIAAIEKEVQDKRDADKEASDAAEIAREREKYDAIASIISEWGNMAMGALSALSGLKNAINERELANLEENYSKEAELLEASLKNGVISQEQYDSQIKKLDEKLAKEQAKIAREQAIANKAMAMFDIAINTAVAIVKSLPNLPLAIAVGALGAVQLAAVVAAPLPKAEKGMYIQGASHAKGGVPIEAEGGEGIMSKGAGNRFGPILSDMNVAGGGIPFYNIPDGGYAIRNTYGNSEINAITSQLEALLSQKIFVTVEDYRRADKKYVNIVDSGNV